MNTRLFHIDAHHLVNQIGVLLPVHLNLEPGPRLLLKEACGIDGFVDFMQEHIVPPRPGGLAVKLEEHIPDGLLGFRQQPVFQNAP